MSTDAKLRKRASRNDKIIPGETGASRNEQTEHKTQYLFYRENVNSCINRKQYYPVKYLFLRPNKRETIVCFARLIFRLSRQSIRMMQVRNFVPFPPLTSNLWHASRFREVEISPLVIFDPRSRETRTDQV